MKKSKYLEMLRTILLSPVMLIFSFFSLGAMGLTACAYMGWMPILSFGTVLDSRTSEAISNIRVHLLDESNRLILETFSDSNGNFYLGSNAIEYGQTRVLVLEDVDGDSNGGSYLPQTNTVANLSESTSMTFYLEK